MRVLDICSGIGGIAQGLEQAGLEICAFVEIDADCRGRLKKHWPNVIQYLDVKTLTGEQLKNDGITNISAISAGFPCQPYSRGNWKREGRGDARDLSGEVVRLVSELKPTVFVGENTEGFIDIGYDAFADDLDEIGYACEAISIPACSVGLPTLERHVWIIAAPSGKGLEGYVEKTIQNIERLSRQLCGSDTGVGARWDLSRPRVCRGDERLSSKVDSARLKQLGNAVDPIVPEMIGRAIMDQEL
jgi:DNA (cytosine-5)-methyltransferase 1